jgi:hypothetical protein
VQCLNRFQIAYAFEHRKMRACQLALQALVNSTFDLHTRLHQSWQKLDEPIPAIASPRVRLSVTLDAADEVTPPGETAQ